MGLTTLLSWIVLGLIAGMLAKLILPGRQGGGFILTTVLGIAGALLGGFLGRELLGAGTVGGFSWQSIATATVGALIILIVFGLIQKARK